MNPTNPTNEEQKDTEAQFSDHLNDELTMKALCENEQKFAERVALARDNLSRIIIDLENIELLLNSTKKQIKDFEILGLERYKIPTNPNNLGSKKVSKQLNE